MRKNQPLGRLAGRTSPADDEPIDLTLNRGQVMALVGQVRSGYRYFANKRAKEAGFVPPPGCWNRTEVAMMKLAETEARLCAAAGVPAALEAVEPTYTPEGT